MSLFIGRIPRDSRTSELEETFSKFGKFTRFDIKHNQGYGFVEYEDKRDAEDAMKELKDAAFIVEWARGGHRPGGSECFHCGGAGHWARDCSKAPPRRSDNGRRDGGRDGGRDAGRDGGRGYDRDRRFIRDKDSNRRREDRERERSPRRNDYREKGYDRRNSDRRRNDDEKDNRRDRRDRGDKDERRREENRTPPRD